MLLAGKTAEFLPGYTLRERIGAGGYGEVWKATAPGGLLKAVKLVYGHLSEERAARELKALERIREVRHPFLLSIERIEVIDGQLVVITELADASLRDRYEQCKAEGRHGIPREELLVYLSDAADALDYMGGSFSLQHLDVKPENLLLVGGRVKVCDFGLVKDMKDVTVSLLGGLTPVYAAPEVFDGHPSLHSDQYSLAIVYQELLTGALPFPGRTPTQLADQHLHSNPRLAPVPPADRAALARALAKDPAQRFPSCRALVAELAARKDPDGSRVGNAAASPCDAASADTTSAPARSGDTVLPPGSPRESLPPSACRTLALDLQDVADVPTLGATREDTWSRRSAPDARNLADWPLPAADPAAAVEDPPSLLFSPDEAGLRPVLVLGIGGTAAHTLGRLRQRWSQRFGDLAAMRALQMLLVDTDCRSLAEPLPGDRSSALDFHQTLLAALGSPGDYRDAWEDHARWLSRRWLSNLPRSRHTEGLRPFGRLALLDHADEVLARLRAAIAAVAAPDALAASAQHAAMPVRSAAPAVILVASVSGGSGSGMALDLAYAARTILAELAGPEASLCGILTHSTTRHASERTLSILNACACLREMRYCHSEGYPGDTVLNLPAFGPQVAPFDDTYLVELGDRLGEEDFQGAAAHLADYLDLTTATPLAALVEKHRAALRERQDPPPAEMTARSLDLSQVASAAQGLSSLLRQFDTAPGPAIVEPANPALACEIAAQPLSCIAARLIENQANSARLARRLLTRVDVAW